MANDILIVDDEADIRDLVAGILDDEGFKTRTARDSDEHIHAPKRQKLFKAIRAPTWEPRSELACQ